jgi:hypothetical protein
MSEITFIVFLKMLILLVSVVSHMEYAELNFFKGPSKQVNIVLDLWGLGLMRIPPMDILQRVGTFLNRDYAGTCSL